MKVGLFSTSDLEGGAPRATFRLFQGLRREGLDVSLVVQRRRSSDAGVIPTQKLFGFETSRLRTILDRLPAVLVDPVRRPRVAPNWVWDSLPELAGQLRFELVNLHLVNLGFLRIESVARFSQPVVWTLHDMWAFTGGCSYSDGCDRYLEACGACPLLGASTANDLSRRIWTRKRAAWRNLNLTVVAPSKWMKECAERSSLLADYPVVCIPYGIDTELFQPQSQAEARHELGLPADARIILFGASSAVSDPRKGFDLLCEALTQLPERIDGRSVVAIVFGNTQPVAIKGSRIPVVGLGPIESDARLRTVYSAADVFAAPSREDNLPNTVMESLACGTPCVAFRIGGMPDLIQEHRTGWTVEPFDTTAFAAKLVHEMAHPDRGSRRSECRRFITDNFTLARQATDYRRLYERVLSIPKSGDKPPL